jgi:hypothetical protein
VLVGIDRAFEAGERAGSLAFCRRRIEELIASDVLPRPRPGPPPETLPLPEIDGLLAALLEGLTRLRAAPGASFEAPIAKVREVRDLLAVASRPNWDYLREKLRQIDEDVTVAVLQALPPEQVAQYEAEAARAVERHRGRVDPEAIEDAKTRYAVQRARERLGLPRVGLL